MTGYYTGDISTIYKILEATQEQVNESEIWRHAKCGVYLVGKPILKRLEQVGLIESKSDHSKGGRNPHLWKITSTGIQYMDILEIYVKPDQQ